MNDPATWLILKGAALRQGLDPYLVGGIAMTESSWEPLATRFEPAYQWLLSPAAWSVRIGCTEELETTHQKTSWGLMQVMGAVARQFGYGGALPDLASHPDLQADLGCELLAGLQRHYGTDTSDAIAAYNAGSPRKTQDGRYENQGYVDAVLAHEAELRGKYP